MIQSCKLQRKVSAFIKAVLQDFVVDMAVFEAVLFFSFFAAFEILLCDTNRRHYSLISDANLVHYVIVSDTNLLHYWVVSDSNPLHNSEIRDTDLLHYSHCTAQYSQISVVMVFIVDSFFFCLLFLMIVPFNDVSLRTGHCGLRKHLKRLGLADSAHCECGSEEQTPEHILQTCPHLETVRQQFWPEDTEVGTKLWGQAAELQRTADFLAATGLRI